MSRRPHGLTPEQAGRSLVHRLAPRIDRIRQIPVNLGLRPDRVYLVWTRYTGDERGEGVEQELARIELLPTPKVSDQTAVTKNPFSAGTLPVGSVRLDHVSAQYDFDTLNGWMPPASTEQGENVSQPSDFYYEIAKDGRAGGLTHRTKYRLLSTPSRVPGAVSWSITLERISEDAQPNGESSYGGDEI